MEVGRGHSRRKGSHEQRHGERSGSNWDPIKWILYLKDQIKLETKLGQILRNLHDWANEFGFIL